MTKEDVIKEFSSLNGVGKAKAELLYSSGFNSLEKLGKTSVTNLVKINGINEKLAQNIKDQLNKEPKTISDKKVERPHQNQKKQLKIRFKQKQKKTNQR